MNVQGIFTMMGLITLVTSPALPPDLRWHLHDEIDYFAYTFGTLAYVARTDQFIARTPHSGWDEVGIPIWGN